MALVTFERTNEISNALSKVLSNSGYVDISGSPFLGAIVRALQAALDTEYTKLYEIAQNVDLGRATGEYLDRWGQFLNEPRASLSYATDMSLSNVRIYISPTVNARQLTIHGDGISIPAGTGLTNDDHTIVCETLDDVYIRPDRNDAYCRIICTTPGAIDIPAGTLTTASITLSDISNVLPSAIASYTLTCTNNYPIRDGSEQATDDDYRYVLLQKAQSIGIFNENTVRSVLDITDIVRISIQEYRGGASIFVETKNIQNVDAVVHTIETNLRQQRSLGLCIHVYPPIIRYFTATVKLILKNSDPTNQTNEQFNKDFVTAVNTLPMGSAIDFEQIVQEIARDSAHITSAHIISASYGGRVMVNFSVGQYSNEKALTSEDRITVS